MEKKQPQKTDQPENPRMPLSRKNYILLAIGFAVILLGWLFSPVDGSQASPVTSDLPSLYQRNTRLKALAGVLASVDLAYACMAAAVLEDYQVSGEKWAVGSA